MAKPMRVGIVGFAAALGVVGWLVSRSQPPDVERRLAAALGEPFSLVTARYGLYPTGRSWLAETRARRPGEFVLDCTYDVPSPAGSATASYFLAVAPAGTARDISFVGSTRHGLVVHPRAVVGDTLIIPIPMRAGMVDHRFVLRDAAGMTPGERARSRLLEESRRAADSRGPDAPSPAHLIRYEGHHLILVRAGVSASLSAAARGPTHHSASGVFEAAAPGAFRLEIAPEGTPPRRHVPPGTVEPMPAAPSSSMEFLIAPRDAPLTVPIVDWDLQERTTAGGRQFTASGGGELPLGAIHLRVGDRVSLRLATWTAPSETKPPPRPMTLVREIPIADRADDRGPNELAP